MACANSSKVDEGILVALPEQHIQLDNATPWGFGPLDPYRAVIDLACR
jgi:hypothetical protein